MGAAFAPICKNNTHNALKRKLTSYRKNPEGAAHQGDITNPNITITTTQDSFNARQQVARVSALPQNGVWTWETHIPHRLTRLSQ